MGKTDKRLQQNPHALRETREETGLILAPADLFWRAWYRAPRRMWFFGARLAEHRRDEVRFGDEGQGWSLMPPARFLAATDAVPSLQARLRLWMAGPDAPVLP